MTRGGLLLLSLSSFFYAACSSSNSGNAGGSCANYVSALRDAAKECGRFNVSPARESEYLARFQQACELALNAPGSGIGPSLLDQCSAQIRQQCGDDDACEDLFDDARGSLGDGAACDVDYQCASGQCKTTNTNQNGGQACGTCAPAVAIGQPCPEGGCAAGATCTSVGTSGSGSVCVAERTVGDGEACGSSTANTTEVVRCASGLYCESTSSSTGTTGTCRVPLGEGAACGNQASNFARCKAPLTCVNDRCGRLQQAGGDCQNANDCVSGLGCDPSQKCAPITWAANGAPCDDGLRRCERGFCVRPTDASAPEGTCKDFIADGQPCDPAKSNEERCDTLASCTNGTCQISNPANCK